MSCVKCWKLCNVSENFAVTIFRLNMWWLIFFGSFIYGRQWMVSCILWCWSSKAWLRLSPPPQPTLCLNSDCTSAANRLSHHSFPLHIIPKTSFDTSLLTTWPWKLFFVTSSSDTVVTVKEKEKNHLLFCPRRLWNLFPIHVVTKTFSVKFSPHHVLLKKFFITSSSTTCLSAIG
jgi:hypothetical protein